MALIVALAAAPGGLGSRALAQPRQGSAHVLLNNAIECHRRGDYEAAANYFLQAQSRQQELSPVEQQDLIKGLELNAGALQARREGAMLLAQADEAFRAGHGAEAGTILRDVTVNQFLTPADKERARQLSESLRSHGDGPELTFGTGAAKDAAAKAPSGKADAKGLLQAGRAALNQGDLDTAERLARESENASSFWTWRLWSDSPSKLRRDVQVARSRTGPASPATGDPNTQQARQLIQQGRQALQHNELERARKLADQACSLKPSFVWNEDTPDKLLADIQKVEKAQVSPAAAPGGPVGETTTVDGHALLKQGRDLYAAGKLDDARQRAILAQNTPGTRWGYFEDTPDKLVHDIQKARVKRDQEEAEVQLADARRLFEQGDLEGARAKAYKAEYLGKYPIWSLGDRPQKLLGEIQAAEAKRQKVTIPMAPPAPPGQAQLAKDTPGKVPAQTVSNPVQPVVNKQPPPSMATISNSPLHSDGVPAPAGAATPPARQLLLEARQLQKDGRVLDARERVVAAQKTGGPFPAGQDRPETIMADLAQDADRQISSLVQDARTKMARGPSDPNTYLEAEANLNLARALASAFGRDTRTIDGGLAQVRQLQVKSGPKR